jgi:hypothetical protein
MQDSKSTFWFSFNSIITPIKTLATVATYLKSSVIKKTQKERDQEANAIVAEVCQSEQQVKFDFFENFLLLKSKSAKLMKVRQ